jgi:hypothetical protein
LEPRVSEDFLGRMMGWQAHVISRPHRHLRSSIGSSCPHARSYAERAEMCP